MSQKNKLAASLFASTAFLCTAGATTATSKEIAQGERPSRGDIQTAGPGKIKCFGAAKAGQNHCGSAHADHSCKGASKKDCDPLSFIMVDVPEGQDGQQLCEEKAGQCVQDAGIDE